MEEQDRRAGALVEVVHAQSVLLEVVRLEVVAGQALELLVRGAVGVHAPTLTRRLGFAAQRERSFGWPSLLPFRPIPTTRRSSSRRRMTGRQRAEVFVEESVTEPPPPKRPVFWPWLLALLALVLVGLGAVYFFTRDDDNDETTTTSTAATTTAQVTVPDVVGTTSSEATATLRGAGLDANLVSVPSDRSPGTVVAQNPSAGEEVSDGSTVRLNVAEAAKPAPDDNRAGDDCADHDRRARAGCCSRRGRPGARRCSPRLQRGGTEGRGRSTFPRTSRQAASWHRRDRRAPSSRPATPFS